MVGVELLFWVSAAPLAKPMVSPKQAEATERPSAKIDLRMKEALCMNP
jgi:hypothetical protein